MIVVTVATPIVAFFQSFGSEAGKDAYVHVKRWFTVLRQRGPGKGSVVVRDRWARTNLVLASDIPEEAFDALSEMSSIDGEYVIWDDARCTWVRLAARPTNMPQFEDMVVGKGDGVPYERR